MNGRKQALSSRMAALALAVSLAALGACTTGVVDAASAATTVSVSGDRLSVSVGAARLELRARASDLLELNLMPSGEASPETPVLAPPAARSGSKPFPGAKIDVDSDPMTITTGSMIVAIDKGSYAISISDAKGTLLLSSSGLWRSDPGFIAFSHASGQHFYGISGYEANAGSAAGILRDSGGVVKAGKQGYGGGPLAWSSSGYGLLVDSDGGSFAIDDASIRFSGCSKKNLECFVMVGKPAEIMSAVSELSGAAPMFPKWAMGFMNSQWGIDQGELVGIVDGYRARKLPIDSMILDFDWKAWGSERYGEWNWNAANFPGGPSGALREAMGASGIHLVGIMKPRIHVNGEQGAYASSHKFWYPARSAYNDYFSHKLVNDLDFSIPECRAWFFDSFKASFDTGIEGWWNDEADGFDNFEFMNMQRSLYEGQRAYSERRVFSLNRNFYSGSQRYAYALWSGDIDTGFASMAAQRERMLSAASLGEAKWGMDSGGFIGHPSPENYARWIEFSAFTPIFRVHGTYGEKRQPWTYGEVAEKAAAKAMRLRYELIPYVYSYERRAFEHGVGLVRPLCFDWPSDPKAANDVDAWMFGDYLLVSPVVRQGQASKDVYLPEGRWIDYFTGEVHEGGRSVPCALDAAAYDDIPLFIKSGAILPSQEYEDFVGQKRQSTIYVDVFPDAEASSFDYYEDDGATYGYERGQYFKQVMRASRDGPLARVAVSAPDGSYAPEVRYYLFRVHGIDASQASLGGTALPRAADPEALMAAPGQLWCLGSDRFGKVAYARLAAGSAVDLVLK